MTNMLLLARRNLTIYLRDRTGVFLSFLAAFILLALYVLFLHQLNADGIVRALDEQGLPYSKDDVDYFINCWVFAGIVMVTTVTTSLGALVGYVDDRSTGRFTEFVVMPVKRWQIVGGYYLSALCSAFGLSSVVLAFGWGLIRVINGQTPSPLAVLTAWGWTLLCAAGFAALNCLIITVASTTGAFVALSTITGTMVGFLAAAYIPATMIPIHVRNVINVLPFAQAAALLRRSLAGDALLEVSQGSREYAAILRESYGFDLQVGSVTLPDWLPVAVLAAIIVVCGSLAVWQLRRRIK
ncbi:MAG: ABC transporter permease [Propionibacteriaceae bacterium]|jgi:multidrug/hemolysin transport system permease protein|nr:ABC transporter permease [Propionibacteriaceae bacterium]